MSFLKSLENQLREEQRTDKVALIQENRKKQRYTRNGRPFTAEEIAFRECLEFTTRGIKAGTVRIFNTQKKSQTHPQDTPKKVSDVTMGFMKNLESQLRTENFMKNLENQLRAEARP